MLGGSLNTELKNVGRKLSWAGLRQCSSILLERLEQVTNDITQDEWKLYHFICNRVLFATGRKA